MSAHCAPTLAAGPGQAVAPRATTSHATCRPSRSPGRRRYGLNFVHVVWVDGTLNMVKVGWWAEWTRGCLTAAGSSEAGEGGRYGPGSSQRRSTHGRRTALAPGAHHRLAGPFPSPPGRQIQQQKKYGRDAGFAVELGALDYVKYAEAFGAKGAHAETLSAGSPLPLLPALPALCRFRRVGHLRPALAARPSFQRPQASRSQTAPTSCPPWSARWRWRAR